MWQEHLDLLPDLADRDHEAGSSRMPTMRSRPINGSLRLSGPERPFERGFGLRASVVALLPFCRFRRVDRWWVRGGQSPVCRGHRTLPPWPAVAALF